MILSGPAKDEIMENGSMVEVQDSARRLATLSLRLFHICQEKERRIARAFGLTTAGLSCIRYLYIHEAPSVGDLARRLEVSSSRITRVIRGLERRELVRRFVDLRDRRRIVVQLTRAGWRTAARIHRVYHDVHAEILSYLDPGEHEPMLAHLESLMEAFERWFAESAVSIPDDPGPAPSGEDFPIPG